MTKSNLKLLMSWKFPNSIIVNMRCGKRMIPIEKLKALAQIYNVSIDYIVELTDEPTAYSRPKNKSKEKNVDKNIK